MDRVVGLLVHGQHRVCGLLDRGFEYNGFALVTQIGQSEDVPDEPADLPAALIRPIDEIDVTVLPQEEIAWS